MSQIINWICLISVILLVLDVMIYFCNDVIKVYMLIRIKKLDLLEKQELTYMKIKLQNKK